MTDHPELLNASRDAETVNACGDGVLDHDYRPFTDDTQHGSPTYLRCVWCHAVACGNYGEEDPCIEPWHHEPLPHRTRAGMSWPIGGDRTEVGR